jgi:hypothetical protein
MNATEIPNAAAEMSSLRDHLPWRISRGAEKMIRINDAAITRNHATLSGAKRLNSRKAMTAPMYCALAEQMKNNSGGKPPTRVLSDFCASGAELPLNRTGQDLLRKFLGTTVGTGTNLHLRNP